MSKFIFRVASCLFICASFFAITARGADLSLSVSDISSADFSARGITLNLPEDGSAELLMDELHIQQRDFRKVQLRCARFALSTAGLNCQGGSLASLKGLVIEFDYHFKSGNWQFSAQMNKLKAKQLGAFLPVNLPAPTEGELDGSLRLIGNDTGLNSVATDLDLANVGFSDTSGLHASEKLRGTLNLQASRREALWNWSGAIVWQSGDLFWQPLYLKGGSTLTASGSLDKVSLNINQAEMDFQDGGHLELSGQINLAKRELQECKAQGKNLSLDKLFAEYAKPFISNATLSAATMQGRADIDWLYKQGATLSLLLNLKDAGFSDMAGRFSLQGLNSIIDWQPTSPRHTTINYSDGSLFGIKLAAGQVDLNMDGLKFNVAKADFPILGGKFELRDFNLHSEAIGKKAAEWHWQFAASLSRISMEEFSQSAGWPKMLGTLAGRIPKVSYEGNEINVDGALLFNMFDGTVVASQLKLSDPFGPAPGLSGNVNMRDLDLDLVTRTFSFGNMLGRIDVDVNNLELQNWQPARFEARIFSSAGNYPKKISQKAVQNISALGGGGAAAALQRSFLSFFENFGYDRIGWSCMLRNGVCTMGGVEDGNSADYAIIKGGGIPAITVMGYNRNVSWNELVTRLKRVIQNNVQPVVK